MELLLLIFIIGYCFQHVGSALLIWKIHTQKKTAGLTFETQLMFLIGGLSRIIWTKETRLINIWFIWVELLLAIVLSVYIIFLFRKYKHTQFHGDIYNPFNWKILVPACLVLCFFFHPGTKNEYYITLQMLVSFSMFMEGCGLLPQIYLMRKIGEVETMTGHYMLCLGIARLFRMVFWIMSYFKGDTFVYLIIADLIHTVLLGDFTYYYFKSSRTG